MSDTEKFQTEMAFNATGVAIAMSAGIQAARRHAAEVALADAIRRRNAAMLAAARTRSKVRHARAQLAAMRELSDLRVASSRNEKGDPRVALWSFRLLAVN